MKKTVAVLGAVALLALAPAVVGVARPASADEPTSVSFTTVEGDAITAYASSVNQITTECPTGTVPVAANWYVSSNGDAASYPNIAMLASGPTVGDTSWTTVVRNSGGSNVSVNQHVLCATGEVS